VYESEPRCPQCGDFSGIVFYSRSPCGERYYYRCTNLVCLCKFAWPIPEVFGTRESEGWTHVLAKLL